MSFYKLLMLACRKQKFRCLYFAFDGETSRLTIESTEQELNVKSCMKHLCLN